MEVKINVSDDAAVSLTHHEGGPVFVKLVSDKTGPSAPRPLNVAEYGELLKVLGAEKLSDDLAAYKLENERLRTRVAVRDTALSSVRGTLRLFREFINANATVWKMGAGVCHHPMWEMVAEALGPSNTVEMTAYEWQFIYSKNRRKLGEIE